jgi:pyruvate dehydrogenase E1 component
MTNARRKEFDKAYNYLRARTKHMQYAAYRHQGLPIGSGVTEAACKTVFTQRFKLSGMRWSLDGAQTILNLRVIILSGLWVIVTSVLLYYKEAKDGQILEEGITEAGSISSWVAAGTAYATHGVNMIPFYIYYSMFGFQRVGDFIWAAADARCRGFLLGGTAGRTTLAGEGLQHQDGQSHTMALTVPTCRAYDPAYAYELAVIIEDGIKRMYVDQEPCFYYLSVMNEQYEMPAMPAGSREGIIKGLYRFNSASDPKAKAKAQLIGSGAILNEAVKAQAILGKYGVGADVWSATSYNELYRDAHRVERWNLLHPAEKPRVPYVTECLAGTQGVVVAASDYIKSQADMIARWIGRPVTTSRSPWLPVGCVATAGSTRTRRRPKRSRAKRTKQ